MAKIKGSRSVPQRASIQGLLEDGYSMIEELKGELDDIVGNASEGLSQTQRIQTLSDTADSMDMECPDTDEAGEEAMDTMVSYTIDTRQGALGSRAKRAARASMYLSTAAQGLRDWAEAKTHELDNQTDEGGDIDPDVDAEEETDDEEARAQVTAAEELANEIEEHVNTLDGLEFPGMYG